MSLAALQHVPLFATLPAESLASLTDRLPVHWFEAGSIVFYEGDHGECFYIVLSGQVAIIKAIDTPEERFVGIRYPGEFVGEMSLLSETSLRTATTRAEQAVELLEINRSEFHALLEQHPVLAYEMLRVQSDRLGAANDRAIYDLQVKNRQLTQAYAELQAAQAQLIEQEALRREMLVASDIQQSMLPRTLPRAEGFELGACMLPARVIGGDFYDAFLLGQHQLGFVVGDVCGKGVPSALLMAVVCSVLRAEANRASSPAEALLALNRHMLDRGAEGMFVTVLYGVLNWQTRQLTLVRAGHELPLIWDANGNYLDLPMGVGHPLGLLDTPALDVQVLDLPLGASVLFFSDGVSEAVTMQGVEYGVQRLRAAVQAARLAPPQVLCDQLLATLVAYQDGAAQADDITLLVANLRGDV